MTRYEPVTAPAPEAPDATPTSPGFVPRGDEKDVARQLLRPCFPADEEMLLIAGFDTFARLLCLERSAGGGSSRCIVRPHCWRAVLEARPAQVLMAHNHPSGIARPSDADLAATGEAARLLGLVGIALSDHLIFTDDGHFSFRRAGLL